MTQPPLPTHPSQPTRPTGSSTVGAHADGWDDDAPDGFPVAGLDRRFYGFVLDRLLLWTVYAVGAYAAYRWLIEPGRVWAGAAVIGAVVVLAWLVTAAGVGLAGLTPGGSAVGLRVVSDRTGGPIGFGRALLRGLVVGVATLPTFGFGTAALAVTAVGDASGRRRGWHDLRAGSVVVDVRPEPEEVVVEEEAPSPIVNLTALRLVPASPHPPTHVPVRRSRGVAKPLPPRLGPHSSAPAAGTVTPRQGLGWPLIGSAPDEQSGAPATLGPAQPVVRATPTSEAAAAAPVVAPPAATPPVIAPASEQAASEQAASEPAVPGVGAPGSRAGSGPGVRPRWEVAFDTGESFEVTGLTLVGRRPQARADEPAKRLVTLPSPDMSLSKTHAQFQVVPDGALVVMDRGSTNGSILIRAGATTPLVGGRPKTLRHGDRVRFGDREMTVTRRDGDA